MFLNFKKQNKKDVTLLKVFLSTLLINRELTIVNNTVINIKLNTTIQIFAKFNE